MIFNDTVVVLAAYAPPRGLFRHDQHHDTEHQ